MTARSLAAGRGTPDKPLRNDPSAAWPEASGRVGSAERVEQRAWPGPSRRGTSDAAALASFWLLAASLAAAGLLVGSVKPKARADGTYNDSRHATPPILFRPLRERRRRDGVDSWMRSAPERWAVRSS